MAKSKSCLILPLLIGFIVALVFGWWVFPPLMYRKELQPIRFDHVLHVKDQGMECVACHSKDDGSFSGMPKLAKCVDCHSDMQGTDPAEKVFVEEYVKKGIEVPWKAYQTQPDNVYFSHEAHKGIACVTCHINVENMSTPPAVYTNRLSGYSKDTMRMWQCERCHAEKKVSNACFVCHK